jgi:hypothetical protein
MYHRTSFQASTLLACVRACHEVGSFDKTTDVRVPHLALRGIPESTRGLISSIGFAAASGLSAVAFLTLTNLAFRSGIERLAQGSALRFILGSLAIISSTSLASGVLLHLFAPDAAGSGVPQLKAAYWKDLGFVSLRPGQPDPLGGGRHPRAGQVRGNGGFLRLGGSGGGGKLAGPEGDHGSPRQGNTRGAEQRLHSETWERPAARVLLRSVSTLPDLTMIAVFCPDASRRLYSTSESAAR